ncbi:MAG: hypothetical protein ACRD6X_06765 [Pyrinomonadaceae bacterium]
MRACAIGTRTFLSAIRIPHSALDARIALTYVRASAMILRCAYRPYLRAGLCNWNADIPVRNLHSALRNPYSAFRTRCAYRPYLRAGFCNDTEMRVSPLLTCGLLQLERGHSCPQSALRTPHSALDVCIALARRAGFCILGA